MPASNVVSITSRNAATKESIHHLANQSEDTTYGVTGAVWLYPGKVISIAPFIDMSMGLTTINNQSVPYFKFWYMEELAKPYFLDDNNQLNLSTSCRRQITLLSTSPLGNSKEHKKLLLSIEAVPYC